MSPLFLSLMTIGGLYLLAAASPGPNFFIISQLSLGGRRQLAALVALGIALGSTTWAVLAMVGVAAVLARIDWLYAAIRLLGAGYLIWFGARLLRNAVLPARIASAHVGATTPLQALRVGLFTSLTNPKSGAFWTSVFASAFPFGAPAWFYLATAATIALLSLTWHLGVALSFASGKVQVGYRRLRRPLDALCGTLLVGLGLRLAADR